MEAFIADLKYSGRRLLARPGFAIIALLTMGLGIGANSAIFSIVNAILLRPLPVEAPEQLVEIYTQGADEIPATSSYPDIDDVRTRTAAIFSGVINYEGRFYSVEREGREGQSEIVMGEFVSGNYFDLLGVAAQRGRALATEDDQPGAAPAVVLSHGFWKRRFASDPAAVGSTLTLNGRTFDIVGVAPPEFSGMFVGITVDLWVTTASDGYLTPESTELADRGSRSAWMKGRLRPGVSVSEAQAAADVLAQQLAAAYPATNADREFVLRPTNDVRIHPMVDRALVPVAALLMAVVGMVLLIACANLANLLLARAAGRRKEIAIRLAIGAGRGRLMRQLLTESTMLALLGGALGLLIAKWTAAALVSFQPPIPIPVTLDLTIDVRVFVFTMLLALGTGVLFGLAPALQATKPAVVAELKDETSSLARRYRTLGLRNALVVLQVATSLVLLIGAGLFVRSLLNAHAIDTGFESEKAAIITFNLEVTDYDEVRGREFYNTLTDRLRLRPEVEAATMTNRVPLGIMIRTSDLYVEGSDLPPDQAPEIHLTTIGTGYFETLGVPLLRGRDFTDADRGSAPQVAIVSDAAARRFWPGEDPIGRRLRLDDADTLAWTIVGVARDTKVLTLGEAPRPYLYLPFSQSYDDAMSVVVRTSGDPAALLPLIRNEARALDPNLPIWEQKTMGEHLGLMLFAPRMGATLLSLFGALAALLASIGLYGVVAYTASQRTREVGIRVALGARPRDVVRLVVRQGMALVAVGAGLGVALALVMTRPLATFLYGVESFDPITVVSVVVLLGSVALVASFVPALRAARVDPMVALRYE